MVQGSRSIPFLPACSSMGLFFRRKGELDFSAFHLFSVRMKQRQRLRRVVETRKIIDPICLELTCLLQVLFVLNHNFSLISQEMQDLPLYCVHGASSCHRRHCRRASMFLRVQRKVYCKKSKGRHSLLYYKFDSNFIS
jgi:hypothetical protein